MAGAYVAKPDETTPPVMPPQWHPDWPFPGPYPPGYEPEFSLEASGESYVAPDAPYSVSAILYDHETYKTNEPADAAVVMAASIGDRAVRLKKQAGDEWASVISFSYAEVEDGFWGVEHSIYFDVSIGDIGETLTLTAISTVEEQLVSDELELEIDAITLQLPGYIRGIEWTGSAWSEDGSLAGATVSLYDETDTLLGSATTDTSGQCTLSVSNTYRTVADWYYIVTKDGYKPLVVTMATIGVTYELLILIKDELSIEDAGIFAGVGTQEVFPYVTVHGQLYRHTKDPDNGCAWINIIASFDLSVKVFGGDAEEVATDSGTSYSVLLAPGDADTPGADGKFGLHVDPLYTDTNPVDTVTVSYDDNTMIYEHDILVNDYTGPCFE